MDNRLTLGVVHIVEWLRPGDIRTGWELFGELEPLGIASRPEVPVKFWRIATRQEFADLLQAFATEYELIGRIPLLHVETHGSVDGIGISEVEGFAWADLMEAIIPLNRLTLLNLTVILAACEGFWGTQMLQPNRRAAAFRGLIGPNRAITAKELSDACAAFYRTVFVARDGDAAVRAMNRAVDQSKDTFWTISAESAFKAVYRGYLQNECTPEAIDRRVEQIVRDLGCRRRQDGLPGRFTWELDRERHQARQHLMDHRSRFDELKRDFFFIDRCPENATRFDVSFEDCQP